MLKMIIKAARPNISENSIKQYMPSLRTLNGGSAVPINDVDFLNQLAKEAQKAYAATAEDDHAVFELPQFAAKIAAAHVQVIREAADKDGVNANGLSDEKMKEWQAIKQRIQVSGKQALANAKTQMALQQGMEGEAINSFSMAACISYIGQGMTHFY